MAFKLAITGKSGSGKTTIVKAFLNIFREYFPEKSILLFDNDLTSVVQVDMRILRHKAVKVH